MLLFVLIMSILITESNNDKRLVVGERAINFTLPTFQGNRVTLSDLRGKVILLDFWASWCLPCKEELPYLDILQKTYGQNEFQVVVINIDNNPNNAIEFLKKYNIKLMPLWDREKKVVSVYDVEKMPTTIFLDKDGRVRFVHSGFQSEQYIHYKKQIEFLLKEPSSFHKE